MKEKALKYRWLDAVLSPDEPRASVRHLLLTLATHMDRDGEGCWPGMRLIAQEMGVHLGTVTALVREARAAGWLAVEERRQGRRGGRHFVYRPSIPEAESVRPPRTVSEAESVRPDRTVTEDESVRIGSVSVRIQPPLAYAQDVRSSSVVSQKSSRAPGRAPMEAPAHQPTREADDNLPSAIADLVEQASAQRRRADPTTLRALMERLEAAGPPAPGLDAEADAIIAGLPTLALSEKVTVRAAYVRGALHDVLGTVPSVAAVGVGAYTRPQDLGIGRQEDSPRPEMEATL